MTRAIGVILFSLCQIQSLAVKVDDAINFVPIIPENEFKDAIEEGSISLACHHDLEFLAEYFQAKNLPFDVTLVRTIASRKCHIHFLPSHRGFRASPDNEQIKELYFDVDALSFVTQQETEFGDSLSILRELLPRIDRKLIVHVGIQMKHQMNLLQSALKFHFGEMAHDLQLRESQNDGESWPQDYLKGGSLGTNVRIMIPRRLYEGYGHKGEKNLPLLETFKGEKFLRSKISWEGGDLQFIRSPQEPHKILLFYGYSAKDYWGKALSNAEYAYILRLEFGSDEVVDVGGMASHVDYFLSFLPKLDTVLVSTPLTGNVRLMCHATKQTLKMIGDKKPDPTAINKLMELTCAGTTEPNLTAIGEQAAKVNLQVKENFERWVYHEDKELEKRLKEYFAKKCHTDIECIRKILTAPEGQGEFIKDELQLAQAWARSNLIGNNNARLFQSWLSVIESQLEATPEHYMQKVSAKIAALQKLGFYIVEISKISGGNWAGVSYTNNLVIDDKVFLPTFGLGEEEARIFSDIEKKIPKPYKVLPIFAQYSILVNGGLHCRSGIVRN